MANNNLKRPQKFKLSDIVFHAILTVIFILYLVAASYFTDTILHDRFLKAALEITQRLTAPIGANLAYIIGFLTPPFLSLTGALAIALVWVEFGKICKRIIKWATEQETIASQSPRVH